MNREELIERIHNENATRRRAEHCASKRPAVRISSRKSPLRAPLELVSAAAAAILLIVLLPRERTSGNTTYASAGIYCNSQCNPDDVLALIDNNINHIRTLRKSSAMPSLLEQCRDEVTSSKIAIQSL